MRTVRTRVAIGFPEAPAEWNGSPALYSLHDLRIAGHPVMEDWERPYMELLARICTAQGGSVLEVGYGMGLAATAIQRESIERHVIVECHPEVLGRCLKDLRPAIESGRVNLISGFWQDIVALIAPGSFDGILFDTYPMKEQELHANHFPFFSHAARLLKPGGVLTYYSDEACAFSTEHRRQLNAAGFSDACIDAQICEVRPPEGCEYWAARTLLAPVVRKPLR